VDVFRRNPANPAPPDQLTLHFDLDLFRIPIRDDADAAKIPILQSVLGLPVLRNVSFEIFST
jgi:hypothetical protein